MATIIDPANDRSNSLALLNTLDDPSDLYDLACLVGTGNFGHVWKGVTRATGEPVALKIVPTVDKDTFFKLMQEIQLLASCKSPFITSFIAAHMKGKLLFFVFLRQPHNLA
jgi:serine/threonine protein kinase